MEYQFDVVDLNTRIDLDIRNDLEVEECSKMKNSAKKCQQQNSNGDKFYQMGIITVFRTNMGPQILHM